MKPLALGKEDLTSYAYSRQRTARALFKQAIAAEKRGDWAAVEASCRETLLVEPGHLEAHWHLALALARQQRYDEVPDPLSAAVAGDWMRWGERSLMARALVGFNQSELGPSWRALVDQYRDQFRVAVGDSLLVVGRRGLPWYPQQPGDGNINHRSELYAYDLAAGRYLRVSRTNGSLVGIVRDPATREVAYVSYRKVWTPESDQAGQAYIREVRVGVIDLDNAEMSMREAIFPDLISIELFYLQAEGKQSRLFARARKLKPGRGERLVSTCEIDGRRGRFEEVRGDEVVASAPILRVGYDQVALTRPASSLTGIAADWGGDGSAGALRLDKTRKTITLPDGESADRDSIQWSPGRLRLVLATKPVDPCASIPDERAVKLYVAEAATGRLHPVAVAEGNLAPVWLDDARLAYVDTGSSGPMVRLIDVTGGGEVARLETTGGMGTDWLPTPITCHPVTEEFDDQLDDADEELEIEVGEDSVSGEGAGAESSTPPEPAATPATKSDGERKSMPATPGKSPG